MSKENILFYSKKCEYCSKIISLINKKTIYENPIQLAPSIINIGFEEFFK